MSTKSGRFWKFANFGNNYTLLSYRRSCQPKVAVFGNLPILATITHCFPIGDHVYQKLPFLEICQFDNANILFKHNDVKKGLSST